ncbi:MAG: sigma-70 family RNA polymerase sigma factor [Verrucomicrobiota bacterium]
MLANDSNMTPDQQPEIYQLLAQHQGTLRGYILSLTADPNVTNDVLQEANLVICKKGDDFVLGTNFLAWACRIAYFEVLRHRATSKRDKLVFDDSLIEQLSEESEGEGEQYAARKHALRHCLEQLGKHNQQLVSQRYFEGLPLEQIAKERNTNANALAQVLYRLRQQLMGCIERITVDHKKV